MPNPVDDNAGSRRAADFHDAMLQLPGYGDDSIFYIVRYISLVKVPPQKVNPILFTTNSHL